MSREGQPSSRPLCSRTPSSTSPIAAISLSTHSSAQATLIAAEKTGRICRGVELDPLYVDVIVRRYEAATGDAATLIETGETFQALSAHSSSEAAPVEAGSSGARSTLTRTEAAAPSRLRVPRTAEVRGSNPLSPTRKPAQIKVISDASG
jgi:hypothetical protein